MTNTSPLPYQGQLPFHLKPQADETFDSWVLRLSSAHALTQRRFLKWVAPSGGVNVLAHATGISVKRAAQTLLAARDPDSEVRGMPRDDLQWVVETTTHATSLDTAGQPYCPFCLTEDAVPYMRRRWLRSYVSLCEVHRVGLLDRCPICRTRVHLELVARNAQTPFTGSPVTLCSRCGGDLRGGVELARRVPVADPEIDRVHLLADAVRTGWIAVADLPPMRALLFFPVLAVVVRLIARTRLRKAVPHERSRARPPIPNHRDTYRLYRPGSCFGDDPLTGDPFGLWRDRGYAVSHPGAAPAHRRAILANALWLFEDWPMRFVDECARKEIWADTLLTGFAGRAPFWYWSVVAEHLREDRLELTPEERDWEDEEWRRLDRLKSAHRLYKAACKKAKTEVADFEEWQTLGRPAAPPRAARLL